MKKLVSIAGSILILTALGSVNAQMAPSSARSPAAAPEPAAPLPPVRPIKKRYLLSHSTPVYQQPNTGSPVI